LEGEAEPDPKSGAALLAAIPAHRVDFINVFNKPNFRLNSLNFTNLPDERDG
jgi:hypothetical protein